MELDTKVAIGRILGEILRLQKHAQPNMCGETDATIYGLLRGFEDVIDEQFDFAGAVTHDELNTVVEILKPYWEDQGKFDAFQGYYDIEPQFKVAGIDRSKAISILTYLNANGQFTELIDKMDSQQSPTECRKFELTQREK